MLTWHEKQQWEAIAARLYADDPAWVSRFGPASPRPRRHPPRWALALLLVAAAVVVDVIGAVRAQPWTYGASALTVLLAALAYRYLIRGRRRGGLDHRPPDRPWTRSP
jgi:uncharacterized membrane protein YfcA